MRIKIVSLAGQTAITVLGVALALSDDGEIDDVTAEQYRALGHLDPEVVGLAEGEAETLAGPVAEEAPELPPNGTTDPNRAVPQGVVRLIKTHPNGSTTTLDVAQAQLEDLTSQGWEVLADDDPGVPDPEAVPEAGPGEGETVAEKDTPPADPLDEDDGLEAMSDDELLDLATEEDALEDGVTAEARGDLIDAIRAKRAAVAAETLAD